jgi:hypothetical protein
MDDDHAQLLMLEVLDALQETLERRPASSTARSHRRRRRLRQGERQARLMADAALYNEIVAEYGREVLDALIEGGWTARAFVSAAVQTRREVQRWREATGQDPVHGSYLRESERLALRCYRWEAHDRALQEIAAAVPIRGEKDGEVIDLAIPIYRRSGERVRGERRPDRIYGTWVEDLEGDNKVVSPNSRLADQFQTENAYDGAGDTYLEAAELWKLRKRQGRTGRIALLRLKDGTQKQCVTAWAAGPPSAIEVTAELALLYRGSLVWEEMRWRWRVPADLSEWVDERSGRPWRAWARVKLPLIGHVDDLFVFAYVRAWPAHYRTKNDAVPYRPPICYALDPELGDWKHRPDPENSFVQRRRNVPELKNWEKAGWGFEAPEHFTSRIGEEPVGPEDDENNPDLKARPERPRGFVIALRIEERGFPGYWQWAPGWIKQPKKLRSHPGAYTLRYVEQPADALSAKREECRRRREAAIDGLLSNFAAVA